MARFFALIPAGGRGTRFASLTAKPKQYLPLGRRTMIEHALDALLAEPRIEKVLVVVAPADPYWREIDWPARVAVAAVGGASRAESVRNGLRELAADADDWVLVHDAARPCLAAAELRRLLDEAGDDAVGGLLALPVADTVKRADGNRVAATIDRRGLWRAQTPQMFRAGLLARALAVGATLHEVTDEASAVERLGRQPLLIQGAETNLKVTTAEDWTIAAAILKARRK
ncbi:MAG: 2-C-methyl-D-erythritol 4-phosphate cytidylyltransferase [Burkholderiales bacterium]|nr:2-C-methyl-D-erythritol 4-phosphate cytidylyltransferase [Burkholderiales bacterium]